MIEIIVIALLLAYIAFSEWNNRKERKTMLNAILASKSDEMVNRMTGLELTDKTEVKVNNEPIPDYTELSNATNDEFDELLKEK